MDFARIIGRVVATEKDRRLVGSSIFVIQPLNYKLEPTRKPIVAVDPSGLRGEGELVYFCESADAGFANPDTKEPIPSDASIVGIVDSYDINPKADQF